MEDRWHVSSIIISMDLGGVPFVERMARIWRLRFWSGRPRRRRPHNVRPEVVSVYHEVKATGSVDVGPWIHNLKCSDFLELNPWKSSVYYILLRLV
jgi:hypothetical protein